MTDQPKNIGPERRREVLRAVAALEPVTAQRLKEETGIGHGPAIAALSRLVMLGLIEAQWTWGRQAYVTTLRGRLKVAAGDMPVLHGRVRRAVARTPGLLDADRLALVLNVDEEDVERAVRELLEFGMVVRSRDGRLRPPREVQRKSAA